MTWAYARVHIHVFDCIHLGHGGATHVTRPFVTGCTGGSGHETRLTSKCWWGKVLTKRSWCWSLCVYNLVYTVGAEFLQLTLHIYTYHHLPFVQNHYQTMLYHCTSKLANYFTVDINQDVPYCLPNYLITSTFNLCDINYTRDCLARQLAQASRDCRHNKKLTYHHTFGMVEHPRSPWNGLLSESHMASNFQFPHPQSTSEHLEDTDKITHTQKSTCHKLFS